MTSPAQRLRAIRQETASIDRPAADPGSTAAWLLIAAVGLGGFAVLTWLLAAHLQPAFDRPLLETARGWVALAGAWDLLSNAANIPLIVLGVGTVLWLFLRGRRREALLVILVLAAATVGSEAVKELIARPRPPGSDTVVPGVVYSYPSGHVLESVTVLGIIAVLVWRGHMPAVVRAGFAVAVGVFVALVALARVAINAHYPSDVLAGFLAGVGVLAVFALLSRPRGEAAPPARREAGRG